MSQNLFIQVEIVNGTVNKTLAYNKNQIYGVSKGEDGQAKIHMSEKDGIGMRINESYETFLKRLGVD